MKKYVLAVMVFFATIAHADTIGVNLFSAHEDSKYCNDTPGVYYANTEGYTLGVYKNSECKKFSTYVGRTFETVGIIGASITLGAVTGYKYADVLPFVIPSITIRASQEFFARISFLPAISNDGKNIIYSGVNFAIERKF